MKLGFVWFARLGLFAPRKDAPDAFDLRLHRMNTRERRREAQPVLFRNRRSLQAA